jgi:tetratricopeptide (TPR) repeat protein
VPRQQAHPKDAATTPQLPAPYARAITLMERGEYRQAIPVLQEFITKEAGLAGPYINLGIAYRHTEQPDEALQTLSKAVELSPSNAVAHHQIAIIHREQGRFEAALASYKQALELAPDYALAHRNLGILYDLYLQQAGPALNHYRRYQELAPQPDNTVNSWIIDLERRVGAAQARAQQ